MLDPIWAKEYFLTADLARKSVSIVWIKEICYDYWLFFVMNRNCVVLVVLEIFADIEWDTFLWMISSIKVTLSWIFSRSKCMMIIMFPTKCRHMIILCSRIININIFVWLKSRKYRDRCRSLIFILIMQKWWSLTFLSRGMYRILSHSAYILLGKSRVLNPL